MAMFGANDPESADKLRGMFGPTQIDEQIRQAIHFCWMALPDDKKSVAEVEKQIRRLVDRALRDLKEDSKAFGIGTK
jgi:hypothetical protein